MDRQKIISSMLIVLEVGLLSVVLAIGLFSGASKDDKNSSEDNHSEQVANGTENMQHTEDVSEENDWFREPEERETFSDVVEQKLASMTTEQKVAQLFLVSPEALTGVSPVTVSGNGTKAALEKYPVAGFVYSAINLTGAEQSQSLVEGAQGFSQNIIGLPLFILTKDDAADYAYHATVQFTEQDGKTMAGGIWTCTYTSSLEVIAAIEDGVNMIYAPENFVELYEAVLGAVQDGTISQVRLENAVGTVLTEKLQ